MKTRFKYVAIVVTCLSVLFSCQSIDPEAPSISEKDIPIVEQPNSQIRIPISIELKDYYKQVESSISNVHRDSIQECEGLQYAYMLKRSPFTIKGSGNTINLSFQGEYWIKLNYCAKCEDNKCKVPILGTKCGVDEPLRKIDIAYSTEFNILKNYKVQSSTSLVTLKPLNKCKITKLNIDATDKLVKYVKGPLTELGTTVDKRIANVDFESRVKIIWKKISKEIHLGSLGYLYINPQEISVKSFDINGSILNTTVGITAKPHITTESKQLPTKPLPKLSTYTPGNGFEIYFDIFASYDSLALHLNKRIIGRKINLDGHEIIVTNTEIYGIGNQKTVIAIEFKGYRKGKIYFTGTPHFNSETNELTFPDLAFDTKTRDLLIELKEWMFNDEFTKSIRARAKFNLSNLINKGRQKFQEGINRNLGDNIRLSGKVDSLTIETAYPAKTKLVLRTLAKGEMELTVH